MIDTDKYEGHQVSEFKTSVAGPNHSWVTHRHTAGAKDAMFVNHATAALITDAPLLLEEVKRLREWKAEVERICRTMNGPNRDTALFIMTNEVEEE